MKKHTVLAALISSLLFFSSCSSTEQSSMSLPLPENDERGFEYGADFYIPPVVKGYEYTCEAVRFKKDQLEPFVDHVFGDGAYLRGDYDSEAEDIGFYMWLSHDQNRDVGVEINSFYFYDMGFENELAGDDEISQGDYIYESAFLSTDVVLDGEFYTLSELCDETLHFVQGCMNNMGTDVQFTPLKASVSKTQDERAVSVTFYFSQKAEDIVIGGSTIVDYGDDMTVPRQQIRVSAAGNGRFTLLQAGPLMTSIKEKEEKAVIACSDALDAAGKKLGTKTRDITLLYSRLEYIPIEGDLELLTLTPFWAFYGIGKNGDVRISVNAVSGEVGLIENEPGMT